MIPAYALYRRSRAHQDLSIEQQRGAIQTWATEQGYEIVREFADDRSGLDTDRRRGFLALIEACGDPRRRDAGVVLCYDVSRFSRLEPDEAAWHEYSLRRVGVKVVYTHEPGANDTGVSGQLLKSIKRVMAHDYSLKLSQTVSRGLRAHAELGHWTGGRPPYGYRRGMRESDGAVRILGPGRWQAKGETVVLIVEPLEAAVVLEQIYTPYVHRGQGLAAIASALNDAGVRPPVSDRRAGVRAWTKSSIWAILRNPTYRGTLVYGKARYSEIGRKRGKVQRPDSERVAVDNALAAIVPAALWEAAQAKHGHRRFGMGRPWHRPYLLSTLIVCGHCGKRFQAYRQVRGRVRADYVCGGYWSRAARCAMASGSPSSISTMP